MEQRKRILVVAGSDSSGGAGLEADQKVIAVHGAYAMTATTALTAQNTTGVLDMHATPSPFVAKQIQACIEDIGVDCVKTGMLASEDTIRVVARAIEKYHVKNVIVDPVMVTTSGHELLPRTAIKTMIDVLLPKALVLTPNIPEARILMEEIGQTWMEPTTSADILNLAEKLKDSLGSEYVLLKGGHCPLQQDGSAPVDPGQYRAIYSCLAGPIQTSGKRSWMTISDYIDTSSTHGTGCSLASALACYIAAGVSPPLAATMATNYVTEAVRTATPFGNGHGPINHFHALAPRTSSVLAGLPFTEGHFIPYLLSHPSVVQPWHGYTHHAFVQELGAGILPVPKFRNYLVQDYLFLVQFSRANALAAYKSSSLASIKRSAEIVLHIQREMSLHLSYCEEWGLDAATVQTQREKLATTAYTRYVLDVGMSQDFLALQIALLPCLLGYGEIGQRLYADPNTRKEGNPYWRWICQYVAEDYVEAVRLGREMVEKDVLGVGPKRVDELVEIFVHATEMEKGFWEMGMEEVEHDVLEREKEP